MIEVYCKKIKIKNYYSLIAQEVQIYNFSEKHPNLIRVRILHLNGNNGKKDVNEGTEETLMYNMALIVEKIVK